VFTRTKHGADKVVKVLHTYGITAAAIHGNKSQNARQNALSSFKNGSIRVLVATDIAARGIDIDDLSHVINFELPEVPETYVHRIGRTGRAGNTGIALSFCDIDEKLELRDIQKVIGKVIPVEGNNPFPLAADAKPSPPEPKQQQRPNFKRGGTNQNGPKRNANKRSW
jgi:ATP-dependent RNA helicase RhlE